jgi:hypothetical protein
VSYLGRSRFVFEDAASLGARCLGRVRRVRRAYPHVRADARVGTLILVELVPDPDEPTLSEPGDVALCLRKFDRLRSAAVFGDQARALLDRIAEDIRTDNS